MNDLHIFMNEIEADLNRKINQKQCKDDFKEHASDMKRNYEEVQKLGFETGPEPQLSVVTYRYVPKSGDADVFNKKLVEAVQQDGRVFISSTLLDGKFTLRAAIVSFRTHLQTIDLLLEVLKEKVELLENS